MAKEAGHTDRNLLSMVVRRTVNRRDRTDVQKGLKRKAIEGDEPEGATKKLKSINPEPDVTSDKNESKEGYHDLPAQPLDEQWTSSKESLSETHLTIEGHPVMEKWETPYMGALAKKATENGGKVMEIGFGMAISATAVQQCPTLAEHVIIELNGDVYKRLLEFKKKYPKVTPMLGGWETQLEKIEDSCMDGILYDTYPLSKATQHIHQFAFVKDAEKNLSITIQICQIKRIGLTYSEKLNCHILLQLVGMKTKFLGIFLNFLRKLSKTETKLVVIIILTIHV